MVLMRPDEQMRCIQSAVTPQDRQAALQRLPVRLHSTAKLSWRISDIDRLSKAAPQERTAYVAALEPNERFQAQAMWDAHDNTSARTAHDVVEEANAGAWDQADDIQQELTTAIRNADEFLLRQEALGQLQAAADARRSDEIAANAAVNARRLQDQREAQHRVHQEEREMQRVREHQEVQRHQERIAALNERIQSENNEIERQRLEEQQAIEEVIAEAETNIRLLEQNLLMAESALADVESDMNELEATIEEQREIIAMCDERINELKERAAVLQESATQLESEASRAEMIAEGIACMLECIALAMTVNIAGACLLRIKAAIIRAVGRHSANEYRKRAKEMSNRSSMLLGADTQQYQTRRSDAENTKRQSESEVKGKEAELTQQQNNVRSYDGLLKAEQASLQQQLTRRVSAAVVSHSTDVITDYVVHDEASPKYRVAAGP